MRVGIFLLALVGAIISVSLEAKDEPRATLESINRFGACVVNSTFSFLYSNSHLPKTKDDFKRLCKSQAAGIKCVKDKSKGSAAILRRGLLAFMSARQRHHRKYCTNTESELSGRFLEASKCVMEKKFSSFRAADSELSQTLLEIDRLNYNDTAKELKRLCCTFNTYRKSFSANIGPECSAHRSIIEEIGMQITPEDLNLVCEDEEKLTKLCAALEPLQFKRQANYTPQEDKSPAVMGLYLFATLGEPRE